MAIKINILPNYFLKKDGTFDKKGAINLCGKIAGVCYASIFYKRFICQFQYLL